MHVPADLEQAVAAPVLGVGVEPAFAPGDGDGGVLEIVGPDLADDLLDLRRRVVGGGRRGGGARRPRSGWCLGGGRGVGGGCAGASGQADLLAHEQQRGTVGIVHGE